MTRAYLSRVGIAHGNISLSPRAELVRQGTTAGKQKTKVWNRVRMEERVCETVCDRIFHSYAFIGRIN